jgi:hypothetical protein
MFEAEAAAGRIHSTCTSFCLCSELARFHHLLSLFLHLSSAAVQFSTLVALAGWASAPNRGVTQELTYPHQDSPALNTVDTTPQASP